MADAPFDLHRTYVHLSPNGEGRPLSVDDQFWATIAIRTELHEGYLVTRSRMTEDWPHWEMHPEGEELLVLLAGSIDLELDDGQQQWTVALRPNAGAWLNRRGVWHRALVHEPSDVLLVTAGRGTQHRPA
ncbi:MAG: hypothetical protein AAGF11_18745 [Myxococcota bacterium]